MRRSNVSSSDMERARALSLRLAAGAAVREETPDTGAYVRFRPPDGPRVTHAPRPAAVEPDQDLLLAHLPLELPTWDSFLAWSLELCRARAAFVVDPQGFVIARRGNVPDDGFEGTGAELCYAMSELQRVDPGAGALLAIDLHFEGRKVVAVRAEEQGIGSFVLGFVGSRSFSAQVSDALQLQLRHSLPRIN